MRCDELTRWLDEGMPAGAGAAARAHAADCATCARRLAAAESIERALALTPPAPPSGAAPFVAKVLARVATETPARISPAAPAPLPKRAAGLGGAILAEPVFVTGLAMLLGILAVPTMFDRSPGHFLALGATVVSQALGTATEGVMRAIVGSLPIGVGAHPLERATWIGFLVALLIAGGLWVFDAVDRWMRRSPERRV